MTQDNKKNVIIALDTPDLAQLKELLGELKGVIHYYKIGFELFTAHGWKAVDLIRENGGEIFLDLKLHDIPNTVSKTATVIAKSNVSMFNVHALGGLEMMHWTRKAVDEAVPDSSKRPKVIAVTILTSHSPESLLDLNISKPVQDQVVDLAKLAHQAGLDGVVSSPQEIELIRRELPEDFLIVTPGIRPAQSAKGDQKRTLGPKEAFQAGASHIVVGRPITQAKNSRKAAEIILSSL